MLVLARLHERVEHAAIDVQHVPAVVPFEELRLALLQDRAQKDRAANDVVGVRRRFGPLLHRLPVGPQHVDVALVI